MAHAWGSSLLCLAFEWGDMSGAQGLYCNIGLMGKGKGRCPLPAESRCLERRRKVRVGMEGLLGTRAAPGEEIGGTCGQINKLNCTQVLRAGCQHL